MKNENGKNVQVVGVAKDNNLRRCHTPSFQTRKCEGVVQMKSVGNQGMVCLESRAEIRPAGLSESGTLSLRDFCSVHPFPSSSFLSTTKSTLSCGSPAADWLSVLGVRTSVFLTRDVELLQTPHWVLWASPENVLAYNQVWGQTEGVTAAS